MPGQDKKNFENVWNIPNILTISRIILTFVVIYLIAIGAKIITVVVVFSIAALTDLADGQIARRFKLITEFGRKADMIADRFLWGGTALAFIVVFGIKGILSPIQGVQILLIMARELITLPFALIAFFAGKGIMPHTRFIAKFTTFGQGIAIPSLILSSKYPAFFYISFPLALIMVVTGIVSAGYYIKDLQKIEGSK